MPWWLQTDEDSPEVRVDVSAFYCDVQRAEGVSVRITAPADAEALAEEGTWVFSLVLERAVCVCVWRLVCG
jgi:hypothetical protein